MAIVAAEVEAMGRSLREQGDPGMVTGEGWSLDRQELSEGVQSSESEHHASAGDHAGYATAEPEESAEIPDVPLPANARLALGFPPRSAINGRARATGPQLTGLFGNGTAGAAGAIAIRMRHVPGWCALAAPDQFGHSVPAPVFGCGYTIDPRSYGLRFFNPGISVTNNPNFPLRYGWFGRDQAGTHLGGEAISGEAINLICPQLDVTDQGVIDAVLILRRTAAGEFQALAIQPGDTAVRLGQSRTPATWVGTSTTAQVLSFGCLTPGASANFANYFGGGDLSNFVQLDGTHGTDAEWLRFANGESPATIWGGNLAAHYRLGGPDDLTKTAGSRSYAAMVEGGTGLYKSSALMPTPGTVVAENRLWARGTTWGATHALSPSAMMENQTVGGGAAGLLAKTSTVFLPVVVGGAATHLEVRVVRDDTGAVILDWTRVTASPVTGALTLTVPGVRPSGGLGHRYDVRREDDPACLSMCRNKEDVGLVIATGPSQSQMEIATTGSAGATGASFIEPTAAAGNYVTFSNSRWRGPTAGRWLPQATGFLVATEMASHGINAWANWWAERFPGVRLGIVAMAIEGSDTQQWLENEQYRSNVGFGYWGNGTDITSGFVTATMKAHRNRITSFMMSWHTSDQGAHLTWFARANEMFGNVAASDSQFVRTPPAVAFAGRSNFVKMGLAWRAHVTIFPVSRQPSGAASTGYLTLQTEFRKQQADWALGSNRAASIDAFLAGYQSDIQVGAVVDPHQTNVFVRGNVRFGMSLGHGVARAAGLWAVALPSVAGAVRTSATVLTVNFTLPSGWALRTADAVAPTEFWVSENEGVTWALAKSVATVALVGSTVRLTRTSGTWATGTQIMYNRGAPISNNNLATDNAELGGQLYAEVAAGDAVQALWAGAPAGLVNGLPVATNVTPLVSMAPSLVLAPGGAVHQSRSTETLITWRALLGEASARHGVTDTAATLLWFGPTYPASAIHMTTAGSALLSAGGGLEPMSGLLTVSDRISLVSVSPGLGRTAVPSERILVVRPESRTLAADF